MSQQEDFIHSSADPELALTRFTQLQNDKKFNAVFSELNDKNKKTIIHTISLSDFLFRLICYKPKILKNLEITPDFSIDGLDKPRKIKQFKYAHLLNVTTMDLGFDNNYRHVLTYLSDIADACMQASLGLVMGQSHGSCPFSVIAMGKLGAKELNFSSDVDLLFTCDEQQDIDKLPKTIRKFVSSLQKVSASGFLYRVDLNLRPWSKSGPLIMPVGDMENYYAISTEPLERFIWLRARVNAGNSEAGNDLINRLRPFVYKGRLETEDLERFLKIKDHMKKMHKRSGAWNVKMGKGGIRDIEFFIQLLQLTNAAKYKELQQTNTLDVLHKLITNGLINKEKGEQLEESYLFLRRLENHLQMLDEKQTHHLPDEPAKRIKIARSMGFIDGSQKQNLRDFDTNLTQHRELSASCFEDILPEGT